MAVEQVDFKQTEEIDASNNVVGFSDKIGKMLAKARNNRELSIGQVASILNIRVEYLTAFEKNDYTSMPESSYTQGFLKSYATYLDLDGDAMVAELKKTGYLQDNVKHYIPQPIETNIVPSRTIVLGSIAILVLLLSVWGIYALQPKIAVLNSPEAENAVTAKKEVKVTAPVIVKAPATVEPAIKEVVAEKVITEPVVEEAQVNATEKAVEALAPLALGEVKLKINSEVWMQLRSPSGKVYMNKTFQAGDEYMITTPQDTVLDIGKPTAVRLFIDGQDKTPWKMSNRRVIKGMTTDINTIIEMNKSLEIR